MSAVDEFAQRAVDALWQPGCRVGVLMTTLWRPGRGQSPRATNLQGQRVESRIAVLSRLDHLALECVQGLASGAMEPDAARAQAEEAGFGSALRVAESPAELAEQLAEAFRNGDNVWVDCSADGGPVLYLKCWYDPSHTKIA